MVTTSLPKDGNTFSQTHYYLYIQTSTSGINPLTPMGDKDRISPYSIHKISSRQVIRIKRNINKGIISWFSNKFSELKL